MPGVAVTYVNHSYFLPFAVRRQQKRQEFFPGSLFIEKQVFFPIIASDKGVPYFEKAKGPFHRRITVAARLDFIFVVPPVAYYVHIQHVGNSIEIILESPARVILAGLVQRAGTPILIDFFQGKGSLPLKQVVKPNLLSKTVSRHDCFNLKVFIQLIVNTDIEVFRPARGIGKILQEMVMSENMETGIERLGSGNHVRRIM